MSADHVAVDVNVLADEAQEVGPYERTGQDGAGGTNRRELTGCRNVVTVAMINTHLRMIVLQKDRHVINVENLTILLKCANLDTLCMNSVRMLPTKI